MGTRTMAEIKHNFSVIKIQANSAHLLFLADGLRRIAIIYRPFRAFTFGVLIDYLRNPCPGGVFRLTHLFV